MISQTKSSNRDMEQALPLIRMDNKGSRFKLALIVTFVLLFGTLSFFAPAKVTADEDKILTDITLYRFWKKITKNPIAVNPTTVLPNDKEGKFTVDFVLPGGGWTFVLDGAEVLSGPEGRNKDLVTIFRSLGKDIGSLFRGKKQQTVSSAISTTTSKAPESNSNHHETSFGVVYANELAAAEIGKPDPKFPAGSVIVRERLAFPTASVPMAVIAMIKRPEGFSKTTGDWEFVVLSEVELKLMSKQTAGTCADCHSKAQKTDWVFRDYLK